MTEGSSFKTLSRITAWLAAAAVTFAALDPAEAHSGASHATQSHAAASTPGRTSNKKASTYLGCWGGGRCPAKLPSNPPRRPTIPNPNGSAKDPCGPHNGGWHNRC
jgi:hypothetical protein